MSRIIQQSARAGMIDYPGGTRRMLLLNFAAGLMRGLGVAIGFTILGALVIYFLQRMAFENIPIIGDFIAEIARIVKFRLN